MANKIFGDMLKVECDFIDLVNFIKILKFSVENDDEAYYLLSFVEHIYKQMVAFQEKLENHNSKLSKFIPEE